MPSLSDRTHHAFALLLLAALIFLLFLGLPQYFRYDDPGWLHFAQDNVHRPWAVLSPSLDRSAYSGLGDYYRPTVALVWIALYAMFGTSPLPYVLVSWALFAASLFYLLGVGQLLMGRGAAWATVAFYVGFAPLFVHGIYRMGLLHVGQATLVGAAYHLLRAARGSRGHFALGVALALASVLARQTAALILPAAIIVYLWLDVDGRRMKRASVVLVAVALLGGSAGVIRLSHPSTSGEGDILGRALFYARALIATPSGIACVPLAIAAALRWRGRRTLVHCIVLGVVWCAAAVAPLLVFRASYGRYLEEAAYGLAIAMAAAASSLPVAERIARHAGRLAGAVAIALLLAPLGWFAPPIRPVREAFGFARASARNTRALVEHVAAHLPPRAVVYEAPFTAGGDGDDRARGPLARALLPAMEPRDLDELLAVLGRGDIDVRAWPPDTSAVVYVLSLRQSNVPLGTHLTPVSRFGRGAAATEILRLAPR